MTRTPHDSFAKEWMQEVLSDFGSIEIEKQLAAEVRSIDLYFCPHPDRLEDLKNLGLLGRMIATPSLLEPFRNAVPEWETRNSREKVFQLEAELRREATRKKHKFLKRDKPFAWILSPTFSQKQQKTFRTEEKPQWGTGVYFLADPDRTAVIAIHQLPKTPDTLLLRLLGRGQVQANAISELIALPPNHPYRGEILRHISRLQVNLKIRQNKTKDIREVMMNLAPAYDKWLEETLTQGRGEGRAETQTAIALRLIKKSMSLDDISECTGLSIEVLQALQANNSVR
jgi:hypothetical protein